MNRYEKEHIAKMSPKYRPIGAWGYFGYTLLFSLPIIGFIAWLICACSGSNINRRSFARSYFCAFLIGLIIALVALTIILVVAARLRAALTLKILCSLYSSSLRAW